MKILISADMEGTCGVSSWAQVTPPEIGRPGVLPSREEYERARLQMTREVNAAAEGALSAGITKVIVNDTHDGGMNLISEILHPDVRNITGTAKPLVMMQGIEESDVVAVFFTGYHGRAGTPGGLLAHTWTTWINDVRVNGVSMGESGITAIVAGHFNIPVALITGDDKAISQAHELLGEQIVGVVVKRGYSQTSAVHLHPVEAQKAIRMGAEKAVIALDSMCVYRLPEEATIEVDLNHQALVTNACEIPGVDRAGWRTLSYYPADGLEFLRKFQLITHIGVIS